MLNKIKNLFYNKDNYEETIQKMNVTISEMGEQLDNALKRNNEYKKRIEKLESENNKLLAKNMYLKKNKFKYLGISNGTSVLTSYVILEEDKDKICQL